MNLIYPREQRERGRRREEERGKWTLLTGLYQVYQDFRLVVGVLVLSDVTSRGWVVRHPYRVVFLIAAQSAAAASRRVGYLPTRFPSAV
jgi:hypothetical protein